MESKNKKPNSDLLKNFDRQMRIIKIFIWIYRLFYLKKRIKVVLGSDKVIWYIPQVKMNLTASWKNLFIDGDIEVPGTNKVDFSKAKVKFASNEYVVFDNQDEAIQCLDLFETTLNKQRFIENQKPTYIYL